MAEGPPTGNKILLDNQYYTNGDKIECRKNVNYLRLPPLVILNKQRFTVLGAFLY